MSITIYNDCDEQEFLNSVRINGLLEHNMKRTNSKLKVPNIEFTNIARNEKGVIVGGVSGWICYLWGSQWFSR